MYIQYTVKFEIRSGKMEFHVRSKLHDFYDFIWRRRYPHTQLATKLYNTIINRNILVNRHDYYPLYFIEITSLLTKFRYNNSRSKQPRIFIFSRIEFEHHRRCPPILENPRMGIAMAITTTTKKTRGRTKRKESTPPQKDSKERHHRLPPYTRR